MVFFDESIEFSDRLLVQIGEKVLREKFYRHGELWPDTTAVCSVGFSQVPISFFFHFVVCGVWCVVVGRIGFTSRI
jgi:hypothetical protein